MRNAFWTMIGLLLLPAPASGQTVVAEPWIDAQAADPFVPLAAYLGRSPQELKRAFPGGKGTAFAAQCAARLYKRDRGGAVYTIDLQIKGAGCYDLGMQALERVYGKPNPDGGYGYAAALAAGGSVSTVYRTTMVLKWCPAGFDVLVVQPAGWRDGLNLTVALPGSWNPKNGKRVAPDSPEQQASCPARNG